MLKITSGLSEKHLKFNFSTYLDQLRELKEIKGDQNLMYSTHPNFLNRMQALIWFSMSNEYNEHFNTNKKGTFDLKNIDDKIYESIKKVIGDEVEYSNKVKSKSKRDQDIIETLMGTDVAPRKKFIFDHALDVSNLDI